MKIQTVVTGYMGENAYVASDSKTAAVIDPGADAGAIEAAMQGLDCVAVLLTHAHFDHIGAAAYFKRKGAKIYMHSDDEKLLTGGGHLARQFGETLDEFAPDVFVSDGDELEIGEMKFKVLHTPGHTDGSVCYISENIVFSGDTLFCGGVGRTDFPSGSAQKLYRSIDEKLFALQGEYKILSGHGAPSSLSYEKKNNPFRIYLCANR